MVKCCRTYEEVYEGDVGKVIKLDRDGLHDLNVQCDWQQKGGTYWVRYIHTELVGEHPTTYCMSIINSLNGESGWTHSNGSGVYSSTRGVPIHKRHDSLRTSVFQVTVRYVFRYSSFYYYIFINNLTLIY